MFQITFVGVCAPNQINGKSIDNVAKEGGYYKKYGSLFTCV